MACDDEYGILRQLAASWQVLLDHSWTCLDSGCPALGRPAHVLLPGSGQRRAMSDGGRRAVFSQSVSQFCCSKCPLSYEYCTVRNAPLRVLVLYCTDGLGTGRLGSGGFLPPGLPYRTVLLPSLSLSGGI